MNTRTLWSKRDVYQFSQFYSVAKLLPSPSALSKFVLSVLKFLGTLKFLRYIAPSFKKSENVVFLMCFKQLFTQGDEE